MKSKAFKMLVVMLLAVFVSSFQGSSDAWAQNTQPPLPPPLETLSEEGAQIRYLGKSYGLDGWITIKNGKEQYFYVTPDGEAMIMGLMFDKEGKMVTLRQIGELQKQEGSTLNMFASESQMDAGLAQQDAGPAKEFNTPAEQLYDDLENSNWIVLGAKDAPHVYMFIDPQCPYCKAFTKDLRKDYIEPGLLQVRMIPVGFKDDTRAQAAFLLAAPNPEGRWYRHLEGDTNALPVTKSINQQGVQRNLSVMQSWKFNVTPLTVYKDGGGEIKIVQGRARDIAQLVSELP
jgi:thiol:disulfide interchange protein DsbG